MLPTPIRVSFMLLAAFAMQPATAEMNQNIPANNAPQTSSTAMPVPKVTRSAFTTDIDAREPVDQLARISAGQEVHYFTELNGLQGRVVTHRWEKDGVFQLGLQFPVGANRWRVHSSKNIVAALPGTWTVTVSTDDGRILRQDTLVVDPLMPSSEPVTPIWEKLPR